MLQQARQELGNAPGVVVQDRLLRGGSGGLGSLGRLRSLDGSLGRLRLPGLGLLRLGLGSGLGSGLRLLFRLDRRGGSLRLLLALGHADPGRAAANAQKEVPSCFNSLLTLNLSPFG